MYTNTRFKVEGGQMITQIEKGKGLDIFNKNIKELDAIKREIDRVGKLTVDPHAGKVKLAEGSAATELEKLLGGKVERIKDGDSLADFIFTSGQNKGKTVDFMFTTSNGTQKK